MLIVLALCLATTVVVAKNTVSPFFNRHEEGIALDEASYGNIQKLKELRDRSVMQDLRRRGRRSLSVGSHPNLPGGGGVGGNNGAATDDGAAGGGAAGGGGPPPPVAGGGAVGGGEAPPPPVDGGASAAGGGGKGFLGKGKGSSTKDGGKGKGLHKKSSKKSGVGKGKGGKGSSGGGDGGDGVAPDDDFMIVDPPQPCMCTPDFCDCEGGLATDYEFVLVSIVLYCTVLYCLLMSAVHPSFRHSSILTFHTTYYFILSFVSFYCRSATRLEVTLPAMAISVSPVGLV